MPLQVVLVQPQIPPNTGNIIRLTANCGAALHLVQPLGFALEDKHLRRAGLDYHALAQVQVHANLTAALATAGSGRCFAVTSAGQQRYDRITYAADDILVFGREADGLPPEVRQQFAPDMQLHIPMRPHNRSLNLSNAVAIVLMEAWRQLGFCGAADVGS